jgi:hypothetical protein
MLRRLIIAGLAAGLVAPIFAITPSNAVILFSCTTFTGNATITPGLGHTQTAQSVSGSGNISGCSNGQSAAVTFGAPNTMNSYPTRPLGCPVALGGAGPEYSDQTPILLGADPSFTLTWASGPASTGIAKAKSAGPTEPGNVRALLVITAGQYAPPAGKKTKFKGKVAFTPTDSFTCVDNSDRITQVSLNQATSLVMQQA